MKGLFKAFAGFFAIGLISEGFAKGAGNAVPRVDLGYATHEAAVNEAGNLYSFNNIRYADPPVGALRFQRPVPVSTVNETVADGTFGFKCPQAYPEWSLVQIAEEAGISTEQMHQIILNDPTASEDCLFLNVVVPKDIFEASTIEAHTAPVLVFLYGGGYVFGHKDDSVYDPSGIIERSQADGSQGVIYVAINYRLGLFGWINGYNDLNIVANGGLHDQRRALDWISDYIYLFGGDSNSVTVLGQSAGAGSLIHHITAKGGEKQLPFDRAIIQSPGWETINVEQVWKDTLATAGAISGYNVASGADLIGLDFATLNQINGAMVFGSANGSFTYSPTVDREYVPDFPENLLLHGRFRRDAELMIGHNKNEAGLFVSTDLYTEEEVVSNLGNLFKYFPEESVEFILTELYPSPEKSDGLYSTEYERACLIVSEASFVCHTNTLAVAFNGSTRNYRFEVPPAVHGQDVPWTFYHGETANLIPELAEAMQSYFTSFAKSGNPNMPGTLPDWPEYGKDARIATFGNGVGLAEDDARNKRCDFWGRVKDQKKESGQGE